MLKIKLLIMIALFSFVGRMHKASRQKNALVLVYQFRSLNFKYNIQEDGLYINQYSYDTLVKRYGPIKETEIVGANTTKEKEQAHS